MARDFVYLVVVLDWFSRRALSWRVSITLEADFCVEAVEEALSRHGKPAIFNSDSKSGGVGTLLTIPSLQSGEWLEHRQHSEVSSAALTRTPIDRALRPSLDLSGG